MDNQSHQDLRADELDFAGNIHTSWDEAQGHAVKKYNLGHAHGQRSSLAIPPRDLGERHHPAYAHGWLDGHYGEPANPGVAKQYAGETYTHPLGPG